MSTRKENTTISSVSAFIIAGGKGKRFGGDKLNHQYNGKPLIAHVAQLLKKIFSHVAIVADESVRFQYLSLPCYADTVKNVGPLAGILTAIHYAQTPRVLAVAGDMPYLNEAFIRYMVEISADFEVTVPKYNCEFEPLLAVYSRECTHAIRRAIERGERRVISFFPDVSVREVQEDEIRKFIDPGIIFFNINYPEDVK